MSVYCSPQDDLYFLLASEKRTWSLRADECLKKFHCLEAQFTVDPTRSETLHPHLTRALFNHATLTLFFRGEPISSTFVRSTQDVCDVLLTWQDSILSRRNECGQADDSDMISISNSEWQNGANSAA